MASKQYIKGRRKEWRICKELKAEGCEIAQRSAGSHSPVDVFAINKEKKIIYFIQSKPDGYKSKKYDEYDWINDTFKVIFEVR